MTGFACVVKHFNTSASGAWAVLGNSISFTSLPSLSQVPLRVSSDLGCETNFGMNLASE